MADPTSGYLSSGKPDVPAVLPARAAAIASLVAAGFILLFGNRRVVLELIQRVPTGNGRSS